MSVTLTPLQFAILLGALVFVMVAVVCWPTREQLARRRRRRAYRRARTVTIPPQARKET